MFSAEVRILASTAAAAATAATTTSLAGVSTRKAAGVSPH